MALDSRYITTVTLEPYFVDKDTGEPLANGTIEFWQDDDRGVPKNVYELTGAPPNYTYSALPNPVSLSAVGTIQDSGGNNIALYYFPYESFDDGAQTQLYYVVVKDEDGVVQFTREGWPNEFVSGGGGGDASGLGRLNQILNPQFVDVLFDPNETLVISFTGASTTNVVIAPEWRLEITHIGAGTVSVTRTSVIGQLAYPYNPPYTITFTGHANVSQFRLIQRLTNNPDIFAPTVDGVMGYVSGSILLASGSSIDLIYAPSVGNSQVILSQTNASGDYVQYNDTIQLELADNTDDSDDGYVDIIIELLTSGETTLSSVQIVSLDTGVENVTYDQTTANFQRSLLLNYYNPLLQFKPIPSYLIGWDFPLNPAQFLGSTVAASAIGANKSKYVWDQTIVFQSANSGVGVTRHTDGAIVLTAAATTQMALVQYLDQSIAREILTNDLAVNIRAYTNQVAGVPITVSLWYTTDVALPDVNAGTNNSIVLTLDANGKPATRNGTWTEVARGNLGNAKFTLAAEQDYVDYPFQGWEAVFIPSAASTATFFAIVVGTGSVTSPFTVNFQSISLVPGKIATIPAPQRKSEVLLDCQKYYDKSFGVGVVPATAAGLLNAILFPSTNTGATGVICQSVNFGTEMYAAPNMVYYNPTNNNALAYNVSSAADMATTTTQNLASKRFAINAVGNAGMVPAQIIAFHWSADARLGII